MLLGFGITYDSNRREKKKKEKEIIQRNQKKQ